MALSLLKSFNPPPIDVKEILRYAGQKGEAPSIESIVDECLKEVSSVLSYKACYAYVDCIVSDNVVTLDGEEIASKALAKNLAGCLKAVIFSCTIGLGIDRIIEKYKVTSPLKALITHAIGVERVEGLANAFCHFLQEEVGENLSLRPRFSAGYGDFKIENQNLFFNKLESTKLLGITLNESLLMSPSKSVTAVIGIAEESGCNKEYSCVQCGQRDCEYRR